MRALAVCLAAWLAAPSAAAQERPPIVVSDPTERGWRVAVQRFASIRASVGAQQVTALREAVETGLEFSSLFRPVDEAAFLAPLESAPLESREPFSCPSWRQIGADAVVEGELELEPEELRVEFRVRDVSRGCAELLRERYEGDPDDLRRLGKAVADRVVGAFTGKRGVADTEIAFVSNRGGAKEVHVMDADGANLRAATRNRSINAFPSWSRDGNAIAYTSYRYRQRPHIFLLTRGRPSPGRILTNLNSRRAFFRAVFDPTGDRLALVMSDGGAAEIFTVGVDGNDLRRLTRNRAIDISPSWSPDGNRLAFVSDRSGTPQVYVMDRSGKNLRRLTFNGDYNTGPSWSPDGRWIAYEGRIGSQFDVWLIDPEGNVNLPLVSHPRSDEHPSWSPDGRKIAFSSTRRGRSDIYVIDVTGENLRRITGEGENTNPAWGPYRRRGSE